MDFRPLGDPIIRGVLLIADRRHPWMGDKKTVQQPLKPRGNEGLSLDAPGGSQRELAKRWWVDFPGRTGCTAWQ